MAGGGPGGCWAGRVMCVVDDGHRSLLPLGVVVGTVTADLGLQLQQGRGGGSGALPLPPLSDVVDANPATIGAGPAVAGRDLKDDDLHQEEDGLVLDLDSVNGGRMSPDKMRQCISLGYFAKSKCANTIGQYGMDSKQAQ